MDKTENLIKKLQCEKCNEPYNSESPVRIYTVCQHQSCDFCYHSITTYNCPICNCETKDIWIPLSELNNHGSSIVKNYESSLRDEISILNEKLAKFEAPKSDHYRCVECEKSESELDMQLCETCHGLKFEDLKDVKSHALCAPCAIKKHMRKGHHTVDFYPYLSAYNFSSHSSNIDSKSEEYKSAQDLLNNTLISFNSLSVNVLENYNVLTDMARRSKNTKQQVEFFEKMEMFIDKETLAEIKEWYECRMGDCVDESEIIKIQKSDDSGKNDVDVDA